ncbi:thymidylate synthase [Rhodobacteraceae bacterium F11138]|nr:thymidylate synthase [Rhodobacteraceae bacterium F11138]
MKRIWYGLLVAAALSACSGSNPFIEDTEPEPVDPTEPVDPRAETVAGDLDAASFSPDTSDPNNSALVVTGVAFNGTPLPVGYDRAAALDTPGGQYQAFTRQPDALNTHSTSYARDVDGTQGVLVVTGGLDGYYNGGVAYARSGAYDRPGANGENTDVRYDGEYVGLMNYPDNGNALLPVPPGTDPAVTPRQAARVYGQARINADFSTNRVKGTVYNRNYVAAGLDLPDLEIAPTDISDDGTFTGEITVAHQTKGDYSGTFGGVNSSAVAGGLYAKDHVDGLDDEEEYGLFVLERSN